MNLVFYVLAVVAFVLAAFGFHAGDFSPHDVAFLGLASFALAHVLP